MVLIDLTEGTCQNRFIKKRFENLSLKDCHASGRPSEVSKKNIGT